MTVNWKCWVLQLLMGSSLLMPSPLTRASITVGSGSTFNFGNATMDLGCSDLTIAGQASGAAATISGVANLAIQGGGGFSPGASSVTLGGNFADGGTFTPGTSRVSFVDACSTGTSQISGTTNFYDFVAMSSAGKFLVFPAGIVQNVAHALTLQGVVGNLLRVVSSAAGAQAQLNLAGGAAQSIVYANARDNNATGATIAPGPASAHNSVDGGNLTNWFANGTSGGPGSSLVPAPTLGAGRWLLLLTLLCAGLAAARRRR